MKFDEDDYSTMQRIARQELSRALRLLLEKLQEQEKMDFEREMSRNK